MRFQCMHCLGVVAIEDTEAGQAVACGHCGNVVVVPATHFSPSAVVGDFAISRELGQGGMGTVYLAHQLSLDRPVALKILHRQFSEDHVFIADFVREARAAARLSHPVIVQAYAVGEEEGVYFFAMEYVEGNTLKQVLADGGRLPADRVLGIGHDLATALDYAWVNQGLVHRDIKPDNIILAERGYVKLADLGLARVGADLLSGAGADTFGTPQYASPEQLLGQSVDNRSDIYSLGATLYRAVTGTHAYAGATAYEIVSKHLTQPLQPPKDIAADIPESVSRVIEVMLAKRPEHRYADAGELAADLVRVLEGRQPLRTPAAGAQDPMLAEFEAASSGLQAEPAQVVPESLVSPVAAQVEAVPALVPEVSPVTPVAAATLPEGTQAVSLEPEPVVGPADSPEVPTRRRRALVWVAAVLVLAALAVVVVVLVLRRGGQTAGGDQAVGAASSDKGSPPAEGVAAQQAILKMIAEAKPRSEILRSVAKYQLDYPQATPLLEEVLQAAAPFAEEEVRALREQKHKEEIAMWRTRSDELQEKERQAAAERERQEREAAAEKQRREAEELQVRQREKELQEFAAEQDKLRAAAMELCRQDKYGEAKLLFEAMAQSKEERVRKWATQRQLGVELAERTYNLVSNTKDKLKGVRLAVPGKPAKARIDLIERRHIQVSFVEKVYGVRGEEPYEKVVDRATVPLSDITEPQMWELCEASWSKDHDDPGELNLLFGAYLLARGMYPGEARKKLTSCNLTERAAPLLAEVEPTETLLRARLWDDQWARLQTLVDQGDLNGARRQAKLMKQSFPEEYGRREAEIKKRIQEE